MGLLKIVSRCPANGFTADEGEENDDDDDDAFVDIDSDDDSPFAVNSDIAIEKEVAIRALADIFASTRSHFLPFIAQALDALKPQTVHFYDGIRKSAVFALLGFVRTAHTMSNQPKFQPGLQFVSVLLLTQAVRVC
jgi:hypothetical protein